MTQLKTNYLYLLIFAALIGETDVEVNLQSFLNDLFNVSTNPANATLAYNYFVTILLAIAGTKAILIAMYYQHLKYEPRSLSSWVIIGLVIASLLMALSFVQLHVTH